MRTLVLALDSCGPETTLALVDTHAGGPALLEQITLEPRTASAALTPALGTLLGDQAPAALRAVVVVHGPGSFTGMRIGLSTAKALSEAASLPLLAISRLQVLAETASTAAAALDAGRNRVFLRQQSEHPDAAPREWLATGEEAAAAIGEDPVAVCEDRPAALFAHRRQVPQPTAWQAAQAAWPRLMRDDWDDTAQLDAHYLWAAEQMLQPGASRVIRRPTNKEDPR